MLYEKDGIIHSTDEEPGILEQNAAFDRRRSNRVRDFLNLVWVVSLLIALGGHFLGGFLKDWSVAAWITWVIVNVINIIINASDKEDARRLKHYENSRRR